MSALRKLVPAVAGAAKALPLTSFDQLLSKGLQKLLVLQANQVSLVRHIFC